MNFPHIAAYCDKGPRNNFEDAYGAINVTNPLDSLKELIALIVADGVGGNRGGDIASKLAIQSITSTLASSFAKITSSVQPFEIIRLLQNALNIANQTIFSTAKRQPDLKGMSTTIVASVIFNDTLYLGWAGDSRAYLFTNGTLRQLTTDHSATQQLIEQGLLDPKFEKKHPLFHAIYQYLGMREDFEPEILAIPLNYGDMLILCTDGLSDVLSQSDLQTAIETYQGGAFSLRRFAQLLVHQALQSNTTDNVTVLCYEHLSSQAGRVLLPDFTLTGSYPQQLANILKPQLKEIQNGTNK